MTLIKYSIGGKITSIEDSDGIEQREAAPEIHIESNKVVICKKCGLQHMVSIDDKNIQCSCGGSLQLN